MTRLRQRGPTCFATALACVLGLDSLEALCPAGVADPGRHHVIRALRVWLACEHNLSLVKERTGVSSWRWCDRDPADDERLRVGIVVSTAGSSHAVVVSVDERQVLHDPACPPGMMPANDVYPALEDGLVYGVVPRHA